MFILIFLYIFYSYLKRLLTKQPLQLKRWFITAQCIHSEFQINLNKKITFVMPLK